MNLTNILLVAGRELRQVVLLKSFWLTLLLVPVGLALGPVLADSLDEDEPTRVVVVDRSGGAVAAAIEARFAENEDRALLTSLSRYVWRHDLQSAAPDAPWAQHGYVYGPADVAAFRAAGGIEAALAAIAKVKPEATPEFDPPPPDYAFDPRPKRSPAQMAQRSNRRSMRCWRLTKTPPMWWWKSRPAFPKTRASPCSPAISRAPVL